VSNSDQLLLGGLSDHYPRDEHFFSLWSSERVSSPKLLSSFRPNSGGCLILPKVDVPKERMSPATTDARKTHTSGQSPSENCERIRDLGFKTSTHIKMYGERFELVSDPLLRRLHNG
jgi:hypothetical protein